MAKIGCFVICPDNTNLGLPTGRIAVWLHIAGCAWRLAPALAVAARDPARRATSIRLTAQVFHARRAERERSPIKMEELVYGVFKPEALAYHRRVIGRLKESGCDAVVLGCTDRYW